MSHASYYLPDLYPRVNDETAQEYELRLKACAGPHGFSEVCALNFHVTCSRSGSCACKCHAPVVVVQSEPDPQLVSDICDILRPISDDMRVNEYQLTLTATEIIERVNQ